MLLSLICPCNCSHRDTKSGAACLSCHIKRQEYIWASLSGAFVSPALRMRMSADSSQPEVASMASCCSASSSHGTARTEAQRLGLLSCLLNSNFQCMLGESLPGASPSPAPKKGTCAESSHPEEASLESCCSVSSAHGTARTEAQRLGMFDCLATSNVKCIFGCPCRAPSAVLLQKCECLQIAGSQKLLTWKAVAQPHLPMQLLAQRHRD